MRSISIFRRSIQVAAIRYPSASAADGGRRFSGIGDRINGHILRHTQPAQISLHEQIDANAGASEEACRAVWRVKLRGQLRKDVAGESTMRGAALARRIVFEIRPGARATRTFRFTTPNPEG